MMVIDRVVTDSNACAVKSVGLVIRIGHVVEVIAHEAVDAAAFAVIRNERQTILGGIFVIGETEVVETEFGLQEVDKSESELAGFGKLSLAGLTVEIDDVGIVIIARHRPVDHIFVIGELAISDHLGGHTHTGWFLRFGA